MTVLNAGVSIPSNVTISIAAVPLRNPPVTSPKAPPNIVPVVAMLKIHRAAPTSRPMESRKPIAAPTSNPADTN